MTMKMILTASALLLLISGNALAGSGYDSCIKDEKALKADEGSACSGLSYLLNPSSCFAKRRLLKEYTAGKCRRIGVAEGVDFSAPAVTPEKKQNVRADTAPGTSTAVAVPLKKVEAVTVRQEATIEQLKEENARLRAEVSHLTTELEQYTKACR